MAKLLSHTKDRHCHAIGPGEGGGLYTRTQEVHNRHGDVLVFKRLYNSPHPLSVAIVGESVDSAWAISHHSAGTNTTSSVRVSLLCVR